MGTAKPESNREGNSCFKHKKKGRNRERPFPARKRQQFYAIFLTASPDAVNSPTTSSANPGSLPASMGDSSTPAS